MPDAPLAGNGDLGVSLGANRTAGEVTLYLGLNQMWFLNAYRHWNNTHADEVAPRRINHHCDVVCWCETNNRMK